MEEKEEVKNRFICFFLTVEEMWVLHQDKVVSKNRGLGMK